jgi:daunorubicin C-13 ketoreductase
MTGRTVLVTGATGGIGKATALGLAAMGAHVAITGRDAGRTDAAAHEIRTAGSGPVHAFVADLSDQTQIHRLADEVQQRLPRIDVLVNNVGGYWNTRHVTADGLERTFALNHLAPFLLTNLLRDRLRGGRVVNTASDAHRRSNLDPGDLVGSQQTYSMWRAYGAGKAANILFTAEAARRWPDVESVSFHPGVVRTNFGTGAATRFFYKYAPFLVTPEKAGALLVWLATTPIDQLRNGAYYVGHKVQQPVGDAADPAIAAKLWDESAKAVGV